MSEIEGEQGEFNPDSTLITGSELTRTVLSISQPKFSDILNRDGVGTALQHERLLDRCAKINPNIMCPKAKEISKEIYYFTFQSGCHPLTRSKERKQSKLARKILPICEALFREVLLHHFDFRFSAFSTTLQRKTEFFCKIDPGLITELHSISE
jgi:hypothetical protein